MIMTATSNIQVRVDTKLKKEAEKLLDNMGLDLTTLIRMTLKRMVIMKNLPFAMGHSEPVDENGFTKKQRRELDKAIKEMNDPKAKRYIFDNVEDFIKDLNA
jgi:DNA-damage-inducible protein J